MKTKIGILAITVLAAVAAPFALAAVLNGQGHFEGNGGTFISGFGISGVTDARIFVQTDIRRAGNAVTFSQASASFSGKAGGIYPVSGSFVGQLQTLTKLDATGITAKFSGNYKAGGMTIPAYMEVSTTTAAESFTIKRASDNIVLLKVSGIPGTYRFS